jgi:ATP-dependent exoDNAse (exonuclease V) beta subunit
MSVLCSIHSSQQQTLVKFSLTVICEHLLHIYTTHGFRQKEDTAVTLKELKNLCENQRRLEEKAGRKTLHGGSCL